MNTYAQVAKKSIGVEVVDDEFAFLHVAQTGYLSGETIWYKLYLTDKRSSRLSSLSKVAYIELVNKDGNSIMQQKIEIENGLGRGSWTIPENTASGTYQIRCYVNSQKHSSESIYNISINIFNPFILPASNNDKHQEVARLNQSINNKEKNKALLLASSYDTMVVSGLKGTYGLRQEVKVGLSNGSVGGEFSVAVFKKDEFENEETSSALNFMPAISTVNPTYESKQFPKEYFGHLVTGTVLDKLTGKVLSGIRVNLVVDGERFFLGSDRSNADGSILFDVGRPYGTEHLTIQLPDSRDSNAIVQLHNPFVSNLKHAVVGKDFFASGVKQALQQRVINHNLQKAFAQQLSKTFVLPHFNDSSLFYGKPDKTYYLDDYTRFNTMEEVLREYVVEVELRKQSQQYKFAVLDIPNKRSFDNNPLVLIDGVPTTDINKVVAFDPLKVKRMDIVARRFFMGDQTFDGIVSMVTYNGDLGGFELDSQTLVVDYAGIPLIRQFDELKYSSEGAFTSRLPDLRSLLYWNPQLTTKKGELTSFSFFTSDLLGDYIMVLKGVDQNGKLVNQTYPFSVID